MYPGIVATMLVSLLTLVAIDVWLVVKRARYRAEIERLRAGMSDVDRRKADVIVASEREQLRVMIELARRQASADQALHLAVALDSARMTLEREGARLRVMPVQVGPERWVRVDADSIRLAAPRGQRTVERIVTGESWEIPRWVYLDRGLPVPADRRVDGALGPVAVVLTGGTVIYSPPTAGPLNDLAYVMPGAIRARAEDLQAILANLSPGMAVYLY